MKLIDLYELEKLGNDLIFATHPDSTLVFIGQSPAYIKVAVGNRRKTIQTAFSGVFKASEITQNQVKNYRQYLHSIGISKELLESDRVTQNIRSVASQDIKSHRVIFIDFISSGTGINSFAELLGYCFSQTVIPIKVLAILSQNAKNYLNVIAMPNIIIIGEIYVSKPVLNKMIEVGYPRNIPEYRSENWSVFPNYEDKSLIEGKYCEDKLQTYIKLRQEIINAYLSLHIMSLNDITKFIQILQKNVDSEIQQMVDQITFDMPIFELYSKLNDIYISLQKRYKARSQNLEGNTIRESSYKNDYSPQPNAQRDERSFESLIVAIDQINQLPLFSNYDRFLEIILKAIIGARITAEDARFLINRLPRAIKREPLEHILLSHVVDKYNLKNYDETEVRYMERPNKQFSPQIITTFIPYTYNEKVRELLAQASKL